MLKLTSRLSFESFRLDELCFFFLSILHFYFHDIHSGERQFNINIYWFGDGDGDLHVTKSHDFDNIDIWDTLHRYNCELLVGVYWCNTFFGQNKTRYNIINSPFQVRQRGSSFIRRVSRLNWQHYRQPPSLERPLPIHTLHLHVSCCVNMPFNEVDR